MLEFLAQMKTVAEQVVGALKVSVLQACFLRIPLISFTICFRGLYFLDTRSESLRLQGLDTMVSSPGVNGISLSLPRFEPLDDLLISNSVKTENLGIYA